MKKVAPTISLFCFLFVIAVALTLAPRQPVDWRPRLIIWSWEHADQLGFVDSRKAAVAYYAGTIILGRDVATLKERHDSLNVGDKTLSFPVFRMEKVHIDETPAPAAFEQAQDLILSYISDGTAHSQPRLGAALSWLQIDYDAVAGDRLPYLRFLKRLKQHLPPGMRLSITALSSWCLGDKWLQAAPVDETVAMIFSMGAGKNETLATLTEQSLNSGARCEQSLGLSINEVSTNEALARFEHLKRAAHIYAFSPLGWTKERYDRVLSQIAKSP